MLKSNGAGWLEAEFSRGQVHAEKMSLPPPIWKPTSSRIGLLLRGSLVSSLCGMAFIVATIIDGESPITRISSSSVVDALPTQIVSEGTTSVTINMKEIAVTKVLPALEATRDQVTDVRRRGSELIIALKDSPMPDAVHALAAATNSQVHGVEFLGTSAPNITLNWRGSNPSLAWAVLLAGLSGTAVSCAGISCQVWLIGGVTRAMPRPEQSALDRGLGSGLTPRAQAIAVPSRSDQQGEDESNDM